MLTLVVMMIPHFDQDHFIKVRTGLFISCGLSYIFPVYHIVFHIEPQYISNFPIEKWVLGGILYILGALLYASYFPESCCQNKFDIFGSSH